MRISIAHPGSYAVALVETEPGDQIKAEAGAMLGMRGDIDIQTASGGILKGLKRAVMGGESFFQNTFTSRGAGKLWLAPPLPGDVVHLRMHGEALILQDGSYLASSPSIDVDTQWQGARGFFSGEGFVMLRVSGAGDLIICSYGAIQEHNLASGERMLVDTGHIVAFTDGMGHELRRVTRGLKSLIFSGEGVVSEFVGPGTVWTQTRSSQSLAQWLARIMPGGGGGSGGRGMFGGLGQ